MLNRIGRSFLCVALTLTLVCSVAMAFDFSELEKSVQEQTLDNGLKIIVLPRHDAPVASFITWADVGSVDDPKEYTGIAHMLEHMAFKGTTTLGAKDFDKEKELMAIEDSVWLALRAERKKGHLADSTKLAELEVAYDKAREDAFEIVETNAYTKLAGQVGGVGINAGTSYDFTMYTMSLPSNKVEFWMASESERFLNPVLRELYKERDVVAEERRMRTESSPFGRMMEEFFALAFKAHPYGVSVIGHMSDIQNYSRDALKEHFNKYYVASNLTVAVVGDVEPKDVFKLAKKYWGRLPNKPKPERVATVEPEQLGERRMVMEDPAQPIYWVGWHIPEGVHPDRPAIDAMLDYLGQGRTSLLYKNLVKDKKIAAEVMAFAGLPGNKYPTMASVIAIPTPEHDNLECETEILADVERLKEVLLTPEEMEGIKARAKSTFINGLVDNMGLAQQLASYQTEWGDWHQMFRELDRINAVTPEDIQRVAKQYFTTKNRVVVMMSTVES